MEFEKYDPARHDEQVMEWFSETAISPDSFPLYRRAVEEALEDVERAVGIEADFRVVIAETDSPEGENLPEWKYVLGMSLSPDYHHVNHNTLYIRVTNEYSKWKDALKHTVAHETGHQEFYVQRELGETIYDHILFEGHAQKTAESVTRENGYDWDIVNLDNPDVSAEELKQELEKKRSWNESQSDEISTLFNPGGSRWEEAEGYAVTYEVVTDIMERNDLSVNSLLEVEEDFWRSEVEKSIDKLYG